MWIQNSITSVNQTFLSMPITQCRTGRQVAPEKLPASFPEIGLVRDLISKSKLGSNWGRHSQCSPLASTCMHICVHPTIHLPHTHTHTCAHAYAQHTQSLISEWLRKHIALYSTDSRCCSCRDSNGFIVLLMLSLCSFNLLYELGKNAVQHVFYKWQINLVIVLSKCFISLLLLPVFFHINY